ncbi:META domain-containing protein [Hyphomonas sp. WL0036]|uniref:META domain-containing protein n=1 Tax=Hyphomonas sediminis TaxID=2866160 RepID=UPI001C7F698A|nr:META domain-containing protein [Hyphomonas sediminis]MBY9067258.1 META domain-containing protein [Hyphomonas sediminis]
MAGFQLRRAVLIPLFLAVSVPALTACQTQPANLSGEAQTAMLTVTGKATYRERIMAPKGSVLKVELSDTSRADAPSISLADWSDSLDDGGVPKSFTLRVNDTLDPRGTYTVRATIKGADGALLWTTDTVHAIPAVTGEVKMDDLIMVKVTPAPAPKAPTVTGGNFTITKIGDKPAVGERPLKISFGEDGRVGGFGGCNSYGGSFKEGNGTLTFGDLVSTMMGCIDQTVSNQESVIHSTLRGKVSLSAGAEGRVVLTGKNGTQLELTPVTFPTLAGSGWTVEAMGGTAVVAGHEPKINFTADGKVNGTTGCNRFFGGYTQNDSRLTFSGIGMTKMACMHDGVMQQEIAFTTILSGTTEARVDGLGNLTIKGEKGISFTARPLPPEGAAPEGDPASLTGAEWIVKDINRGGVIDNSRLTLTFTADGNVSGSTNCNSFSGGYSATGTTITFTSMAITERACVAPALADQETRYTAALQGEMAWRLTADGALELTREGGHQLLLRR